MSETTPSKDNPPTPNVTNPPETPSTPQTPNCDSNSAEPVPETTLNPVDEVPKKVSGELSASVTSLDSVGTTSSVKSFKSGIRPPSRIGRPCAGQHKPAIPTTPTKNSSAILTEDTDSFIIGQRVWVGGTKPGRIAFIGETQFAPGEWAGIVLDEPIGKNDGSVSGIKYFQCEAKKGVFSRLTRLTRVPLDQPGMGSGDTFVCSTPSNGHRKSVSPTESNRSLLRSAVSISGSNTSLASTAHIDYKVGDRVIVKSSQGSKLGYVRFIGHTEFANGEWVGVELDDPKGKNDGSVNGKRYFDCKPNFGLFAPPSKISKSPSKVKPGGNCQVHSGTGGLPPSGLRRANSKESMVSLSSLTSAASGVRRVRLANSSISPVKKLPPKSPTTPLPTRTALQDVLKEKQQHIEQLLKERDLERSEIIRAANQAEEAEQKYSQLKLEYDKYRAECEDKLQEHMIILNKLKDDRSELIAQLENEKRKNEDLQFQFEEASITKGDVEGRILAQKQENESKDARVKELEALLGAEKLKTENDTVKLFETEELLMKAKDEIETLKNDLQLAKTLGIDLEGEKTATQEQIELLQKDLQETQIVLNNKIENIKILEEKLNTAGVANEKFKEELEELSQKFTETHSYINQKDAEITIFKQEIDRLKGDLSEKDGLLEKLRVSKEADSANLEKEIKKLKMELSAKHLDLESQGDQLKEKEEFVVKLQEEVGHLRDDLEIKTQDLVKYQSNLNDLEGNLKKELEAVREELRVRTAEFEKLQETLHKTISENDLILAEKTKTVEETVKAQTILQEELTHVKQQIQIKIAEFEAVEKGFHGSIEEKDAQITAQTQVVAQQTEEIKKLTSDLESLQAKFEANSQELQTKYTSANEEKEAQLHNLTKELANKTEEFTKATTELNSIKTELMEKSTVLDKLTKDYEDLKLTFNYDLANKTAELNQNIEQIKEKDNQIQNLQTELQTTKMDLQSVSNDLVQYQNNLSDVENNLKKERDEIRENLKQKIVELENLKQEFGDKLMIKEKELEEAIVQVGNKNQESLQLQQEVQKMQQTAEETMRKMSEEQQEKLAQAQKELSDLKGGLNDKVQETEELKMELKTLQEDVVAKQGNIDELTKKLEELLINYQLETKKSEDFNVKLQEIEKLNLIVDQKNEEIAKLVADLELVRTQLETSSISQSEELQKTNEELESKQSLLSQLEAQMSQLKTEIETTLQNEKLQNEQKLRELETKLQQEKQDTVDSLNNKIKELEVTNSQLLTDLATKNNNLEEISADVVKKVNEIIQLNSELNNLKSGQELSAKELQEKHQKELQEREEKLAQTAEEVKLKNEEIQQLNALKAELEIAVNSQQKDMSKLQEGVEEANKEKEKLNEQLSHLEKVKIELENDLGKSREEIQTLTQNKQSLEQKMQSLTSSSDNASQQITQVNEQLAQKEQQINDLNAEHNKTVEELKKTLTDIQNEKNNLEHVLEMQRLDLEEKSKKSTASLNEKIITLQKEKKELEDVLDMQKFEYEDKLKKASQDEKVEELEKALKAARELHQLEVSRMKEEIEKVKETVVNGNVNQEPNELLEEKIFAENQVAFLNSIIVDMQKKNEEQKARIEILEMGYSPNAAAELNLLGFNPHEKTKAPRMYCDICEEFDLHETEDCPQQSSDDPMYGDHFLGKSEAKPKPPPRPYCNICEVFGHETEDCTEDQEF